MSINDTATSIVRATKAKGSLPRNFSSDRGRGDAEGFKCARTERSSSYDQNPTIRLSVLVPDIASGGREIDYVDSGSVLLDLTNLSWSESRLLNKLLKRAFKPVLAQH